MKTFTNITRIAALAAMAAIGISLYACEKKEKAGKPTEEADAQAAAEPAEEAKTPVIDMVFVQGGTFTMGCTPEQGEDCEGKPAQSATLSDFHIGKYEVTNKLWNQIMG
jgi:formylglycine-generating enzyme required for sulfatase activity